MMNDPFQVLGVSHSATAAEIKAAYHAKARLYHPDKQGSSASGEPPTTTSTTFLQIQQAWECLCDDARRTEYQKQQRVKISRETHRYTSAIPLQQEDCYLEELEDDDGENEQVLLYNCRCGATLEVTPLKENENDKDNQREGDHPLNIVECLDCSLLYNTTALCSS
mmetsp:Transcript_2063/g.5056  ORF Transcript_2063/g.5056 Transcript_2063/m.5056 type:complete len:166 (-) Transcript_2063:1690-2187(-)